MEDDDSTSNPTNAFPAAKVRRGIVTTTTTEDEDDDTSSQSNSNNEVILTLRREPVSSANTDSLTGGGDPDVGCSPTSTGLNSTTEDADVEDNSSPRSGERITTSSSSSSDGYNYEDRPHSQQNDKNSSQDDSSEKLEKERSRSTHTSSFKYARPSSTIFPPFGRSMTNSAIPAPNQYSSSSSPVSFGTLTPNPFALMRSPGGGSMSHHPHSGSMYHHDTSATSRSLSGPARNATPFASEGKSILRPSSLSGATASTSGPGSPFAAVRNPFGSTSNSSVSSSSFVNNPFNSPFGNKQDELAGSKGTGQLFGTSNSTGADDIATTTTAPFEESCISVKSTSANSILRQSKLSNVHYPCTSSDNSEARYSGGTIDPIQTEIHLQQQPSTSSTTSSEATAKSSIPVPNLNSDGIKKNNIPPTLFQSISSSVGHTFSQPTVPQSAGTASDGFNFVFGSNISDRVTGASNNDQLKSPSDSTTLPNGVSSTSSAVGLVINTTSPQSSECEGMSIGSSIVHSSTEEERFQGSSRDLLNAGGTPELCFPSSSSLGERKRKLSDKIATTGEENESNVLQMSCRLFVFDGTTSTWIERGRGQLRLNDKVDKVNKDQRVKCETSQSCRNTGRGAEEEDELSQPRPIQSRIIVRTKGSLRLMLNTNVWSGMKIEKPAKQSVRFTANDNGTVRIFVVQSTPSEADVLFSALGCRVRSLLSYETPNRTNLSYSMSVRVNQQPLSTLNRGITAPLTPPTSSFCSSTLVKNKREEIDSSEFDDSDEDQEKSDNEDSPTKKKRLEQEDLPVLDISSPTTTSNDSDGNNRSNNILGRGPGLLHVEGQRSTLVPSIQVDKPEATSDDDEDEY